MGRKHQPAEIHPGDFDSNEDEECFFIQTGIGREFGDLLCRVLHKDRSANEGDGKSTLHLTSTQRKVTAQNEVAWLRAYWGRIGQVRTGRVFRLSPHPSPTNNNPAECISLLAQYSRMKLIVSFRVQGTTPT